ncbi:MAG: hypothetical protein GY854_00170, partial [Deltaproteobacteria bacterium]|nr:hypothetical protein [Deltaproteobacteria bacterium]
PAECQCVQGVTGPRCGMCADDTYEENDRDTQSSTIILTPEDTFTENDLAICAADEDWFAIDLAVDDFIDIKLEFTDASGDVDFFFYYLYSAFSQQKSNSQSKTDDEGISYKVAAGEPGTYLIGVKGFGGEFVRNEYSIDVEVYDPGEMMWIHPQGGNESNPTHDGAIDVAALPDNSFITVGWYNNTATFGAGEPTETQLIASDDYDSYIAKYARDGSLIWAKSFGGNDLDYVYDLDVFSDGSFIVSGQLKGTAVFGAGESNEKTLTTTDDYTTFLAKYNSDGTVAWAKEVGSYDAASGVWTADCNALSDGTLVVTGSYWGTVVFGQGEANEISFTADLNVTDLFLAKYSADGTLLWAKRARGNSFTGIGSRTMTSLSDDSILLSGGFDGTVIFGPGESNETTFTSAGIRDVYVAKYETNGDLAWARRAGTGTSDNFGEKLHAFSDDSFWVVGGFNGTMVMGEGEPNETLLTSADGTDVFISNYNADGTLARAERVGGNGLDWVHGIYSLADGSVFVTGYFGETAVFDPGEASEETLTSVGSYDFYLAKYDADGTLVWVKRAGGPGWDAGTGVVTLADGTVVVTGWYEGTVVFNPSEPGEQSIDSIGIGDGFVAGFAP